MASFFWFAIRWQRRGTGFERISVPHLVSIADARRPDQSLDQTGAGMTPENCCASMRH
jgi:hypothetical protein